MLETLEGLLMISDPWAEVFRPFLLLTGRPVFVGICEVVPVAIWALVFASDQVVVDGVTVECSAQQHTRRLE